MSGHASETPPRKRARLHSMKRPRAGLQRPPIATNPARLRSLADMLNATSSRAEAALGNDAPEDAWTVVQSTMDNLASLPIPDASRSAQIQTPIARPMPDPLAPSETAVDAVFPSVPYDASIKTSLRVVSAHPLFWMLCTSQHVEFLALSDLVSRADSDSTDDHLAKQTFYKALLHFRTPASPLPAAIATQWQALIDTPSIASRRDAVKGVRSLALQRLTCWHSALQSLYFGFRHGHIPQFYVLLSTTTVLFTRSDHPSSASHTPTPSSQSTPRALCSSATVGLRSLLREYAVPFAVVEAPADQLPSLVVDGHFAVHALYNFILSAGPRLANATDVPVLLCDHPFRGCTFSSAEVCNVHKTKVVNEPTEDDAYRFSVQISGMFTPRQVAGFCQALRSTQNDDFTVYMETDSRSSRLNACQHVADSSKKKTWKPETAVISDGALQGASVLSRVEISKESVGFSVVTKASD